MEEFLNQLLTNHIGRINLFVIGKVALEIILFVVLLKLANKTFHLFFEKIIEKLNDNETKKQYQTLRQLGIGIIDTIIVLFFATNILENLGVDMKPILATAGVLGVAVGFGGKKFVEDVFTGLSIILTGQIRVGDVVTVNGITGVVEKVMLTMIVLRSFNGDVSYLRNGQIDTVVNQTKDFSFAVFNVGVAYDTDLNHLTRVLNELGKEIRENQEYSRYILSDLEINGLNAFQDSDIVMLCRIKTTPQEKLKVFRKFNEMIKNRFEQEHIEIPFPQRVVYKVEN